MLDIIERPSKELNEIETILNELWNDLRHPVNDSHHPYHRESRQAVNDLIIYADNLRNRFNSYESF